ncbi:MAG: hypothetical protein ACYST6_08780 [Planctomycetota bacterium]
MTFGRRRHEAYLVFRISHLGFLEAYPSTDSAWLRVAALRAGLLNRIAWREKHKARSACVKTSMFAEAATDKSADKNRKSILRSPEGMPYGTTEN